MLRNKNIVLGITGGIAAYKSAELLRGFIKAGANVRVVMTENATKFITPVTFQTLSGNPVYMDTFFQASGWDIGHISLAEMADVAVIAPATANIIGKIASGIADDLLSTFVIATKAPIVICPAMNSNMYTNGIVKENIEKLSDAGYHFVESEYGELACGVEGPGRFPDIENIIEEVCLVLTKKDLVGQSVLVTAGPTREPLDPVRFISNYSSGKMGYEIAKAAKRRGASVTLVSGPTSLPAPLGIKFIEISSAIEMRDAVMEYLESSTIVIKAAAVADYRPSSYSGSKIKKSEGLFTIPLERNPDIIYEIGKNKGNRIVVGFAMETENTIENARGKMASKNMDLIVANNVNEPGSGFLHDTNIVKIIDREGNVEELPLMNKSEVADRILDRIRGICNGGK